MENRILLIAAILASMMFTSCKEDVKEYPLDGPAKMEWKTKSGSGDAVVWIDKSTVNVYCGPDGGAVQLKSSVSNLFVSLAHGTVESDSCERNEDGLMVAFKHKLCKVKAEGDMLIIDLPPYAVREKEELEIGVSGGVPFSLGTLNIYRRP
ncbi:MAG: hypothetical protein ACI30N_07790 [Muribaculaceae bacterium]